MFTTFTNRILLYSLAVWNFATVSSLELPTDLHDSHWKYNNEEGNGFVIFYKEKMVFDGEIWSLVSLTGNFMSFQRNNNVTIDGSEKFLYKCWLYKRVTSSLYYFFPMTGMFQNKRAHVSADDALDVCDYCTNTEAKLHILHPAGTPCECTPECSQLTISNKCTGANHDASSTNCVSGTTAVETTAAIETTTRIPITITLSSTTTETKEAETTTFPITTAVETTMTTLPITTTLSSTATETKEAETTTLPSTTTPLSFSTTTKESTTTLQIPTTTLSSTTTTKETTTIASVYLTTMLETTEPPATTTALPTTVLTLQTTAETPYDPITSTKLTTSRPDETNKETSTTYKKNISALDRIGLNEDAFVGVVSGSLIFVYLVVAIVGCACCVFILGRRRKKRKRKEKESQENLVPEGINHFQNKSFLDSLPQVFHRIDE